MASPQLEHGYTKIANELMEAFAKFYMPSNHWRCLFFILRYIYGYQGKYCVRVSNTEIENGTNIKRHKVSLIMKDLECHNVVSIATPTGSDCERVVTLTGSVRAYVYEFNKNYETWIPYKTPKVNKAIATPTGSVLATPTGSDKKITPIILKKKDIIRDFNILIFKKSVQVPDPFPIIPSMINYAEKKGFDGDIKDLTEHFVLHHKKKGTKWQDWYSAWQLWVRNAIKWDTKEKKERGATEPPEYKKYEPPPPPNNIPSLEDMKKIRQERFVKKTQ